MHLTPDVINLSAGTVFQGLGYDKLSLLEVDYGGLMFEMVVPAANSHETTELPTAPLQVTATDEYGIPLSSGSLELISKSTLGLSIVEILDTGGSANIPVPIGDYNVRISARGFEPYRDAVAVPKAGA